MYTFKLYTIYNVFSDPVSVCKIIYHDSSVKFFQF